MNSSVLRVMVIEVLTSAAEMLSPWASLALVISVITILAQLFDRLPA